MRKLIMTIEGEKVPVNWSEDRLPTQSEAAEIEAAWRKRKKPAKSSGWSDLMEKFPKQAPSKGMEQFRTPSGGIGARATVPTGGTEPGSPEYMRGLKSAKEMGITLSPKAIAQRKAEEKQRSTAEGINANLERNIIAPISAAIAPAIAAVSGMNPMSPIMSDNMRKQTNDLTTNIASQAIATPFNIGAEFSILTSPETTGRDKLGATANIALNFLPVEEFVGGNLIKGGKYVIQEAKAARMAKTLREGLAKRGVEVSKDEALKMIKGAKDAIDSGAVKVPVPTKAAEPKTAPAFKSQTEGGFNTSRRTKAEKVPTPQEIPPPVVEPPPNAVPKTEAKSPPKAEGSSVDGPTLYHGTSAEFDTFDLNKSKAFGNSKFGHWFTNDKNFASYFGDNVKEAQVSIKNPHVISVEKWNAIREAHAKDGEWFKNWKADLQAKGHDGLKIVGKEEQFAGQTMPAQDVYAAFEDSQVSLKGSTPEPKPIATVEPTQTPKVETPTVPKTEPKPEVKTDMGFNAEPKPKESPKATGLANRTQEREALDGIINEVEKTKGKSAKDWHTEGKKAFQDLGEDDVTRLSNARKIAARIAAGEEEFTGAKVGIATEAKRLLMNARDLAEEAHLANPKDKAARSAYESATQDLDGFLNDVQSGKGRWSDVGRALQQGTTFNEGDFASVLEHVEKKNSVGAKTRKQLEDLTGQVAAKDKEIADLKAKFAAGELITKPRKYDREKIVKEIDDLWDQFHGVKGSPGVKKGARTGAVSLVTRKDIEALGERAAIFAQIVKKHVQLNAGAGLEDFVLAVQKSFKAKGYDIDRQLVIDLAAERSGKKTTTQAQKELSQLRAELQRETSLAKLSKDEKAAIQQGKQAIADLDKKARASVKAQQKLQSAETKLKGKNQSEIVKANTAAEQETLKANAERRKKLERIADLRDQIGSLDEQLRTGQFRQETKRELLYSRIEADLLAQRDILAGKVRGAVRSAQSSTATKIAKGVRDTVRGTILGSDIGILTRQGLFSLSRPAAFAKGVVQGTKSAFSEKAFVAWERSVMDRQIGGRSMQAVRKKAGLSVTDSLGNQEELLVAKLFKKIPVIGKYGGGLERFQQAFINTVRTEIFDRAFQKGMSEAELTLRAQFINNATGRGNIKQVPKMLENIMTSPRYEASRWAMLAEPFKNVGVLGIDAFKGKANRAALANLQDMAVTAAGIYGLYKASELAGYSVNYDPKSPDFLKMRRGEEVWDPTAGISPRLRDTLRVVLMFGDPDRSETLQDSIGKTVGRTVSPTYRTSAEQFDLWLQRNAGATNPKSLFAGLSQEGDAEGWAAFAPLVTQTFWRYLNEDPENAASATLREFLGQSVNRYPSKN